VGPATNRPSTCTIESNCYPRLLLQLSTANDQYSAKRCARIDNLAPDIQEELLFLPRTTHGRDAIKEAVLRPIAKTLDWKRQRQMWKQMKTTVPPQSVV
jgi:hypothetical protein